MLSYSLPNILQCWYLRIWASLQKRNKSSIRTQVVCSDYCYGNYFLHVTSTIAEQYAPSQNSTEAAEN